jgi:hypothetical protein
MLFFDITEYSYPTTSNRRTTNEMATTMTPAQFDWRQFSMEHIQRETGNDDDATTTMTYNKLDHPNIGDYDDQEEPAFNKASANRTTTSNAERRHQQRHSPLRSIKPPAIPAIDTDADVKEAHECVQKPKTRAERRAIDAPLTETDVPPETTKATKRERRSDYWVQRDDERRNAARTFKTQSQVLSEDEEEELHW